MTSNQQYGSALIVGTLMAGLTMLVHPTGVDSTTTAPSLAHQMQVLVAVHTLALLSVPVSVFGFVGVTRILGWAKPEVLLAFIVYSFSAVSIVFAAIADGLINAAILPRLFGADPDSTQILRAAIEYNRQLNQACAQVYVVGSSLAILLWSIALVKLVKLERGVGLLGGFVALASVIGLLSGHIRMSAHGFGLIVMLQSVWIIVLGISIMRTKSPWLMDNPQADISPR